MNLSKSCKTGSKNNPTIVFRENYHDIYILLMKNRIPVPQLSQSRQFGVFIVDMRRVVIEVRTIKISSRILTVIIFRWNSKSRKKQRLKLRFRRKLLPIPNGFLHSKDLLFSSKRVNLHYCCRKAEFP